MHFIFRSITDMFRKLRREGRERRERSRSPRGRARISDYRYDRHRSPDNRNDRDRGTRDQRRRSRCVLFQEHRVTRVLLLDLKKIPETPEACLKNGHPLVRRDKFYTSHLKLCYFSTFPAISSNRRACSSWDTRQCSAYSMEYSPFPKYEVNL